MSESEVKIPPLERRYGVLVKCRKCGNKWEMSIPISKSPQSPEYNNVGCPFCKEVHPTVEKRYPLPMDQGLKKDKELVEELLHASSMPDVACPNCGIYNIYLLDADSVVEAHGRHWYVEMCYCTRCNKRTLRSIFDKELDQRVGEGREKAN